MKIREEASLCERMEPKRTKCCELTLVSVSQNYHISNEGSTPPLSQDSLNSLHFPEGAS